MLAKNQECYLLETVKALSLRVDHLEAVMLIQDETIENLDKTIENLETQNLQLKQRVDHELRPRRSKRIAKARIAKAANKIVVGIGRLNGK